MIIKWCNAIIAHVPVMAGACSSSLYIGKGAIILKQTNCVRLLQARWITSNCHCTYTVYSISFDDPESEDQPYVLHVPSI